MPTLTSILLLRFAEMLTDVITFPGKPYTYHIKVSSIQSGTSSKPSTAAVAGSNRDGQRSGEKRLPPMANANPVLAASNQLEAVRVRAGLELQRTSNVNTVIRVASLGRNANRANQRAARHHFLLSSNQAYLSPSGGYVELKHLGLDCVHVGQCWLDTGIALVGNKEVSFRLYCQRESVSHLNLLFLNSLCPPQQHCNASCIKFSLHEIVAL